MGRSGQTATDLRAVLRGRTARPPLAPIPTTPKELPCEFDTFLLDETRLAESAARFLAGKPGDAIEIKGPMASGGFRFNWPLHDSDFGEHRADTLDEVMSKASRLLSVSVFGGVISYVDMRDGGIKEEPYKGRIGTPKDRIPVDYTTDGNGITDIHVKAGRGGRLGSIHGDAGREIAKAAADGFSYDAVLYVQDGQLLLTFTPKL